MSLDHVNIIHVQNQNIKLKLLSWIYQMGQPGALSALHKGHLKLIPSR